MPDYVILVDEKDRPVGTAEKLAAHLEGQLHRAFSVFVFNSRGEMLLQRRHPEKYHSGGLWSNACCSHPRPGEATAEAAVRRLSEELGISPAVQPAFTFLYRAELGGLIEHEYDHIFLADHEGPFAPDEEEVDALRWAGREELHRAISDHPERYTYWFRALAERAFRARRKHTNGR